MRLAPDFRQQNESSSEDPEQSSEGGEKAGPGWDYFEGDAGVSRHWLTTRESLITNPTSPGRAIHYSSWISPCVPQENTTPFIKSGELVGATGKEHLSLECCAAAGMHTAPEEHPHTWEGPMDPTPCTANTSAGTQPCTERGQATVLRAQSLPGRCRGKSWRINKLIVPLVEYELSVMNWLPALQLQWKAHLLYIIGSVILNSTLWTFFF